MAESFEIKPNVLYIDDLQTNLVLFRATFEKDYNVIITDSGTKAFKILKNQDIQVLVTDQRMPEVTGTELLEIVAREYPDIRSFLLTAYTDFETVVEAINKGHIQGYILGIYITDLAYTALFGRHLETIDYLEIVRTMGDKIRVTGALDETFLERAKRLCFFLLHKQKILPCPFQVDRPGHKGNIIRQRR